jgi:serine/threonine protein kinase
MFPGAPPSLRMRKYENNGDENNIPPPNTPLPAGRTKRELAHAAAGAMMRQGGVIEVIEEDGTPIQIRKSVKHGDMESLGQLRREKRAYDALKGKPKWKDYILPYDGGKIKDKSGYIILDYVPGNDLYRYITMEHPSRAILVRIFLEVIEAMEFCYSHGVLHGDIQNGNVYISSEDGRARLFDFGEASVNSDRLSAFEKRRDLKQLRKLITFNLEMDKEEKAEFKKKIRETCADLDDEFDETLRCIAKVVRTIDTKKGGGRRRTRRSKRSSRRRTRRVQ